MLIKHSVERKTRLLSAPLYSPLLCSPVEYSADGALSVAITLTLYTSCFSRSNITTVVMLPVYGSMAKYSRLSANSYVTRLLAMLESASIARTCITAVPAGSFSSTEPDTTSVNTGMLSLTSSTWILN